MHELTDSQARDVSGGLSPAQAVRPPLAQVRGPVRPLPQLPVPKGGGWVGLDPIPTPAD